MEWSSNLKKVASSLGLAWHSPLHHFIYIFTQRQASIRLYMLSIVSSSSPPPSLANPPLADIPTTGAIQIKAPSFIPSFLHHHHSSSNCSTNTSLHEPPPSTKSREQQRGDHTTVNESPLPRLLPTGLPLDRPPSDSYQHFYPCFSSRRREQQRVYIYQQQPPSTDSGCCCCSCLDFLAPLFF